MSSSETTKRVLWIDDDSPVVGNKVDGIEFHTAQNCRGAIQLLEENPNMFDSLIIDIILPQGGWRDDFIMNPGIELTRHLKETLTPDIPVAIFSIFLNNDRISMAEKAGANVVISKQEMGLKGVLEKLDEELNRVSKPNRED